MLLPRWSAWRREVLERKKKSIVATKLSKLKREKTNYGRKTKKLWQLSCWNCRRELKKYNNNRNFGNQVSKNRRKKIYYGNQVAEIVGEEREKLLGILACQKWRGKKRNWQPSKKKRRKIDLWQWNCRKWEEKKKNCGNGIVENWREKVVRLKKNILQHRFLF